MAFLLKALDPHWRLAGKLEDEVPLMLSWLKYPFQVSLIPKPYVSPPSFGFPIDLSLPWRCSDLPAQRPKNLKSTYSASALFPSVNGS